MQGLNLLHNPYPTTQGPLVARRGVVATSQPLAAQAGLQTLQRGGNAVDAAIATAITLSVVEPTSNGIGGDAFALIWDGQNLHGLNGSGRAPARLSSSVVKAAGFEQMPTFGWLPVTVPGTPRAWSDLHARFGRLPFATLFEPAIHYAEAGFGLSPALSFFWKRGVASYRNLTDPCFKGWMPTFAPGGSAPGAGEQWSSPDHGRTLRLLADSGCDAFYSGRLAEAIADFAAETGGYLEISDLKAHTSTWVEPISTNYGGYDVWEIPPNGQGLAALIALRMLDGIDLGRWPRDSVESFHTQIEAMKLAFADGHRYIGDPAHVDVPVAGLLDECYAAERRALIGDSARVPEPGLPPKGGTVYLCAADSDGMMVSYIQSNYTGFGSGIVVPGTGIALHNRGLGFSLQPGAANELQPGRRPFHTIIPAFLTREGTAIGPFGVMGGDMQPQGHLQMVVNTVTYGFNPQASLDAPRWRWTSGLSVDIEHTASPSLVQELVQRGHEVVIPSGSGGFGRGQIIWRLPNGSYVAGTEHRTDGAAVGW